MKRGRMTRQRWQSGVGLTVLLLLSHGTAAVVAVELARAGRVAAALAAALATGVVLTAGLQRTIWLVQAVLSDLNAGRLPEQMPTRRRWPLGGLVAQVNALIARQGEVHELRQNLLHQAGESAAQQERNRLARELHDSVTQTLFTASVLAEATPRIWDKERQLAIQNMANLSQLIRGALAEMRSMLIELRSGDLRDQTLEELLHTLVEAAQGRSRVDFRLSIMDIPELADRVTLAFYRTAREALNNVIVHSRATRVDISLIEEDGRIELLIRDNGRGFDPGTVPTGHLGIKIMRERAAEIGADLSINSEADRGTEILLTKRINS